MSSAEKLGVDISLEGAKELARRSRGTPRLANRILKRVRDYAQVRYDGKITEEGSHEELIAKGGYYSELVKLQMGEAV